MVVFNLDSLVHLFTSTYESYKSSLIASMKSEKESHYWRSRGKRFENFQFRPKAEVEKPSEWLLVGYALSRSLRWLGGGLVRVVCLGRREGGGDSEDSVQPAEEDEGEAKPGAPKKGIFQRMGRFGRRAGVGISNETTIP
jgi:hypothetical protein